MGKKYARITFVETEISEGHEISRTTSKETIDSDAELKRLVDHCTNFESLEAYLKDEKGRDEFRKQEKIRAKIAKLQEGLTQ